MFGNSTPFPLWVPNTSLEKTHLSHFLLAWAVTFLFRRNGTSPVSTLSCTRMTYGVQWSIRDLLWLVLGCKVYRPGNGLRGWWVWPLHGSGDPDGSFSTASRCPGVCCKCTFSMYNSTDTFVCILCVRVNTLSIDCMCCARKFHVCKT